MEDIKLKVQNLVWPILIAIIGFFLVQTYSTIQEINAKVDTFMLETTAIKVEMIEFRQEIRDLQEYKKDNEAWIKSWLEEYQGAVQWAKKNSPDG